MKKEVASSLSLLYYEGRGKNVTDRIIQFQNVYRPEGREGAMRIFIITACFILLSGPAASAQCRQFVQLWSAGEIARDSGTTEQWVVASYRIKVWAMTTGRGKGRVVGIMLPGSRALLLAISPRDYKVKSPLDGSVGWVGTAQVQGIIMQDDKTFQPCR